MRANLGSFVPRLITYHSDFDNYVAASINSDGSFNNGYVSFLDDRAELMGGFFNTDSTKQNETLAGAFVGGVVYGKLIGQMVD